MKIFKHSLLLAASWLVSSSEAFSFAIKDLGGEADNGSGGAGGLLNVTDVLDFEKLQTEIKKALEKKQNMESSDSSSSNSNSNSNSNSDGDTEVEVEGQEGRRDLQSCGTLLIAIQNQLRSADHCECSSTLAVTCSYEKTCVLTGDICADTVDITIDITSGVNVKYCSTFSEPEDSPFEDTCVTIGISGNGQEISECKRASYGFQQCDCTVCDDQTSLNIDCSRFERRAKTSGCQELDLGSADLFPFVPEFMLVYRTMAPTKSPTPAPIMPTTQNPTRKRTPSPTPKPTNSNGMPSPNPIPPVSTDKTCELYPFIIDAIGEEGNDMCGCNPGGIVECVFADVVDELTGLRATYSILQIELTDTMGIKYCTEFDPSTGHKYTCVDSQASLIDNLLNTCDGATYDGKQCECTVCEDRFSLNVDCSAHDQYAYTDGCQLLPSVLKPVIPAFQLKPAAVPQAPVQATIDDPVLIPYDVPTDTSCMVFMMLSTMIPNSDTTCGCSDSDTLSCYYKDICNDEELCADVLRMNIKLAPSMTSSLINICIEYAVEFGFDLMCMDVEIGLDQSIQSCNGASLGDNDCTCSVCGSNGLAIDCSAHDPFAYTDGCQELPTEFGPLIANFQIRPPSSTEVTSMIQAPVQAPVVDLVLIPYNV